MKIERIGQPQLVMSNRGSKHCYFGWPTVARLQNGKLAVAASGFRLAHICPFGKTVVSYSEDEGESYTAPAPVIDTVLDDRDGGILAFGEKNVIVTSFNNAVAFQRRNGSGGAYRDAYLDQITPEQENAALGSTYRISRDGGVTFGPVLRSPVTSPHGPAVLKNGEVLWVGRTFDPMNAQNQPVVQAWQIREDGSMQLRGMVPPILRDGRALFACEPHVYETQSGTLLCHIRDNDYFTTYQTESQDGGRTWTQPHQLLPDRGGAPAHIMCHSSGVLISAYGYREQPYGIRLMFSTDQGESWETGHVLYENTVSGDLGYPSTVELADGSLLTVFYAKQDQSSPAEIWQQRWKFAE